MTIEEAIEKLNQYKALGPQWEKAIQLGIEGLERIEEIRRHQLPPSSAGRRLPSETEE